MASIKIHQDIYNYKKKYVGFTASQLRYTIAAIILFAAIAALLWWRLELSYQLGLSAGFVVAFILILCGFFPIFNMPFSEFCMRSLVHNLRGSSIQADKAKTPEYTPKTKEYQKMSRVRKIEVASVREAYTQKSKKKDAK